MRIDATRTALIIGVLALAAACSSGTKSAAHPTTAQAPASASSAPSAPSASAATSASTDAATPEASTTPVSAVGNAAKDVDTCALLPLAEAGALAKVHFTSAKSSTIATGQDQCTYDGSDVRQLVVIVYQPSSGVTWTMLDTVQKGVGDTKSLAGVGDRATIGSIELDVASGPHLIAIEGGGGLLTGEYAGAVAVAKAVIAGLK